MLKIKTVLTRTNIMKYWKLSIGMCQSDVSRNILLIHFSIPHVRMLGYEINYFIKSGLRVSGRGNG